MIRSYELNEGGLRTVFEGDWRTYQVNYIYGSEETIIKELTNQYHIPMNEIVNYDDEVAADVIRNKDSQQFVFLSFLLPELNRGFHLDNLVNTVIIFILENKLILVSRRRIDTLVDLLNDVSIHSTKNFGFEISLKIMTVMFRLMSDELRTLKGDIDKLETSIAKSGPVKPVFTDLLRLQKFMITLSSTYTTNKKIIDFFKQCLNDSELSNKDTDKTISRLYDLISSMNRMVSSYSTYLDNIESMINNMSSYQLNAIMKTLTEISIVLTIPAIIFGLWGMNVHVPFEKSSYGLLFVIGISIVLASITWIWLRRKKYF